MAALIGILVIAFFAGVFGSMLGVGGGVIMVPVLSLAFGVPIKTAIATSIVCVIATSSMAQTTFAARGMTNMRLGMFLEVATTVGAIAGGITAILVDGRYLQVAFACAALLRRLADGPPQRRHRAGRRPGHARRLLRPRGGP